MVDALRFESPIVTKYQTGDGDLTLRDESSIAKLVVRAAGDTQAADALAVPFGSSRMQRGALIVGQRPHEWIVLGHADAVDALLGNLDRSGHVSVIDHTHARAAMRITGTDASSVLEKVCGLDWHDDMTPDGAATSGSVAKVNCDVVRHDFAGMRSYLVMCDRSFAQYLFDALVDAGAEFSMQVAAVTRWGPDGP